MKQFKFYSLLLFLFVFVSSCKKNEPKVPNLNCEKGMSNHPNADKYEKLLNKLSELGIPGVSITIISPEGTWSKCIGYADISNNVALSPCHTLRIGSVSKIYCATTILKLQEEGVLNINDNINKYIPKEIADKVPNANKCTIKQLLNHTAGIPEYSTINSILGILNGSIIKKSATENIKTIYNKKADFEPGTDKLYSNSNYLMLSLVIKYATGKNSNDIIYEKIIEPLHLDNTHVSNDIPNSLSRAYYDVHDNGIMMDLTTIDNNAVGGQDMLDGGMISNSYDLALFFRALANGNIINATSLEQMKEFTDITQDLGPDFSHLTQYGLGLMKIETKHGLAFGHYGTVHCFNAFVYHFPVQNTTVAIIRNGESVSIKKYFESVALFDFLF